jgi:hypothetical protein
VEGLQPREVRFAGTIDEALYLRASRASSGRTVLKYLVVAAVVGGLSLVSPFLTWLRGGDVAIHHFLVVFVCLYLALVVGVGLKSVEKMTFASNKMLQAGFSGRATEEGVEILSPYSNSRIPWDRFHKSLVQPGFVLLYHSAQFFNVFGREHFSSEEDWETFTGWARSKIPAPQPSKPTPSFLVTLLVWIVTFFAVVLIWSWLSKG